MTLPNRPILKPKAHKIQSMAKRKKELNKQKKTRKEKCKLHTSFIGSIVFNGSFEKLCTLENVRSGNNDIVAF